MYIAYDSDIYGQRAAKRTKAKLDNLGGYKSHILVPENKDWNEDLNSEEEGRDIEWVM